MNIETRSFIFYLLMVFLTGFATALFIHDIFFSKTATVFDYVASPFVAASYCMYQYKLIKNIES